MNQMRVACCARRTLLLHCLCCLCCCSFLMMHYLLPFYKMNDARFLLTSLTAKLLSFVLFRHCRLSFVSLTGSNSVELICSFSSPCLSSTHIGRTTMMVVFAYSPCSYNIYNYYYYCILTVVVVFIILLLFPLFLFILLLVLPVHVSAARIRVLAPCRHRTNTTIRFRWDVVVVFIILSLFPLFLLLLLLLLLVVLLYTTYQRQWQR